MRDVCILMHGASRPSDVRNWAIDDFVGHWRNDGLDVEYLFGTEHRVPARILLVHVDLSVVPDEYLEFAAGYERVINGTVRDIRKSTYSTLQIGPDSDYDGPVIVKSDYNCAFLGERILWSRGTELDVEPSYPHPISSQLDYRLYRRASAVPRAIAEHPSTIVERFAPEWERGLYHTRCYHFLGPVWTCVRLAAREPIVLGRNAVSSEDVEPPASVVQVREKMGLDYGKIDFVISDGQPIVIDINKTTGSGAVSDNPIVSAHRRKRAAAIHTMLGGGG